MSSNLGCVTLGITTLVTKPHGQQSPLQPNNAASKSHGQQTPTLTISENQRRTLFFKDADSSRKNSKYDLEEPSSESEESTLCGSSIEEEEESLSVLSASCSSWSESRRSWSRDSGNGTLVWNESLVDRLEKCSRTRHNNNNNNNKAGACTSSENRRSENLKRESTSRNYFSSRKYQSSNFTSSGELSDTLVVSLSKKRSSKKTYYESRLKSPPEAAKMVVGSHLKAAASPQDLYVKIILLGDYSVGKSSLLRILARQSAQLSADKESEGKHHQLCQQQQKQKQQQQQQKQKEQQQQQEQQQQEETNQQNHPDQPYHHQQQQQKQQQKNILEESLSASSTLSDSLTTSSRSSSGSCWESSGSWQGQSGRRGMRGEWLLVRSSLQPGEFVEVEFLHRDRRVTARVADTGGQERYRSMTTSYYRGAHGGLLMFDVTKEESFDNLDTWIENIDRYKTVDEFPCILVGTRCKSPTRCIPFDRASEFAESRGLPYMELDMGHMTDIRRVFEALLDSVTLSVNKNYAPITISIRPDISNCDNVMVQKHIGCAC